MGHGSDATKKNLIDEGTLFVIDWRERREGADRCCEDSKWYHLYKMAAMGSRIFWLCLRTVGGSGDASSVYVYVSGSKMQLSCCWGYYLSSYFIFCFKVYQCEDDDTDSVLLVYVEPLNWHGYSSAGCWITMWSDLQRPSSLKWLSIAFCSAATKLADVTGRYCRYCLEEDSTMMFVNNQEDIGEN